MRSMRGYFLAVTSTLILVAAFTTWSSKAIANTPGDLGSLTAPTSLSIGNAVSGAGSVFSDAYSFSLTADASLASVLASVSFSNVIGISGFWTSLWSDGDVLALGNTTTSVDPSGTAVTISTINYSPLLSGPTLAYEIRAGGTIVGSLGSYGGNFVLGPISPAPEPEIYAMLVAGLGVLGFVTRRKRQMAAAV